MKKLPKMKIVKHPTFGKMRGKTIGSPKVTKHRMGGLPKRKRFNVGKALST